MLNTKLSSWPSFSQEEAAAVSEVLLSNKVNYWTGTECRNFEKEFAIFADAKFAVALANGTVALDLALKALDVGIGDEVITTSRTFLATASSIVTAGAIPVFADVDLKSQNITCDNIEKVMTNKSKAIIVVHLAGMPADMDPIVELAASKGLYVIEDCAQAHGAKYKGRSVGSFGHIGAWSFCQDKIITTGGEGGMVTTNDKSLWEKMWSFKDHGKSYDSIYNKEHKPGFRWVHDSFGTNWRMTEMQAVIGRIQLNRMPEWTQLRNKNQNKIWETCSFFSCIDLPISVCNIAGKCKICIKGNECLHAAYKCYVYVNPENLSKGWSRDRIITEIESRGIPCYSGSCSEVYLEKAFETTDFAPRIRLTNAKRLGERSLMFLVHPTLTQQEIDLTCIVIKDVLSEAQL